MNPRMSLARPLWQRQQHTHMVVQALKSQRWDFTEATLLPCFDLDRKPDALHRKSLDGRRHTLCSRSVLKCKRSYLIYLFGAVP